MSSSSNCSMGTNMEGVSTNTCTLRVSVAIRLTVLKASRRLAVMEMPPFTTKGSKMTGCSVSVALGIVKESVFFPMRMINFLLSIIYH